MITKTRLLVWESNIRLQSVTSNPNTRNNKGIAGENLGENRLWITSIFAQPEWAKWAKTESDSSPTVPVYLRHVIYAWAKWAKWAKLIFRPSPGFVGEMGESLIETRPLSARVAQTEKKTHCVESVCCSASASASQHAQPTPEVA